MLGVLGEPQRMMGLHAHTTMSELKERPVITTELKPVTLKNRKTGEEAEYLMPSVNVNIVLAEPYEAARHGETVRFGEVDKIKIPGNLSAVNSLLTRHEEDLEGMDGGIDPRFRAIADRNTHEGGDVHGQDLADTASDFIGRFQWVSVGYMEPDSELDYVMRTVFRDLPRATAQERADYADREAVMAAVVNLAGLIRKAAKMKRCRAPCRRAP
jgi:hypothetical protein